MGTVPAKHGKGSVSVQQKLGFWGATASFKLDGETLWTADLSTWRDWQAPSIDLYQPDLAKRLDELGARDGFLEKLARLVLRDRDDRALRILGGKAADGIPWEALVDRNFAIEERRDQYAPVRSPTEGALPANPAPVGPPRILLLIGEGDGHFDAAESRERLARAIEEGLTSHGQGITLRSAFLTENLAGLVTDWIPHIVIVFAHGRSSPTPAVYKGANLWLDIGSLAASLTRSSTCPPHWVFIACSVGENSSADDLARFPAAYLELARSGIATMVAMRSRIRPNVGEAILLELLERLLAGESVAKACAMARHAVRASSLAAGRWDWAAPAVWAGSAAEDPIAWADASANLRARQWDGLRVLRAGMRNEAIGLGTPGANDVDRAKVWIGHSRVLVSKYPSSSEEFLATLSSICVAARRVHGKTIVPIVPLTSKESFTQRMIGWARSVRGHLSLTAADMEYAKALEILSQGDVHEGLGRLMALPDAFVIFVEAPGQGVADKVIWDTLNEAPGETIAVLCGENIDADLLTQHWVADMIHTMNDIPKMAADALKCAPISMGLWAVLRRPASASIIAKLADEPEERSKDSGLLVEDSGCRFVMADGARREIRRLLGADGVQKALDTYIERRSTSTLSGLRNDPLEELRIFAEANRFEEAASLSTALCDADAQYWSGSQWLAFAAVVDRESIIQRLTPSVRLKVAKTYISRQMLGEGEKWLHNFVATTSEELARYDMMLSEIAKGQANIAEMWSRARSAVDALRDDRENAPVYLLQAYEMNLARLDLYFNRNARAACEEFKRLLAQIGDPTDAGTAETCVALKRNLAEGLFEFEACGQPRDVDAAGQHLREAIAVAKDFALLALAAECTYSLAKLEESSGTPDVAISTLDKCAQLATDAKFPLAFRIARLRQYRIRVQYQGHGFDHAAFRGLIRPLDAMIAHAWAARYSAQSRNWAARRSYETGDYENGAKYLTEVLSIAGEVPGLSTVADLFTLITAHSGLKAIAGKTGTGSAWDEFAARSDVAAQLGGDSRTPEQLWEEGI